MNLYLVNIGIIVCAVVALALITMELESWRRPIVRDTLREWKKYEATANAELEALAPGMGRAVLQGALDSLKELESSNELESSRRPIVRDTLGWFTESEAAFIAELAESEAAFMHEVKRATKWSALFNSHEAYESHEAYRFYRDIRILRLARILNVATTVLALVPIGFAIYNLVTNSQRQALNFNLTALATLVVTKGGLFLLTMVLIPAAKSIPPAVAAGFAWKKVNEWLDARKKQEKPPTD